MGAPGGLEAREGHPALESAPYFGAAAEQIHGQPHALEFIGRLAPAEAARGLTARLGDEGDIGRKRLEARGVGDVDLDATAALPLPLVKGRLEAHRAEAHAG